MEIVRRVHTMREVSRQARAGRAKQQAAMLYHRPAKPPLGAAEDLVAVGGLSGDHDVTAGPAIEAEEPLLVGGG